MIQTRRRRKNLRLRCRIGRCGAATKNDEFANSLDRLSGGMNTEFENSAGRSFGGSDSQV